MYLETQRLILRGARATDAEFRFRLWNDPYVLQYNCITPPDMARALCLVTQDMASDKALYLTCKGDDTPFGLILLDEDELRYGVNSLSVSYELLEPFANRGYMTEALEAAAKHAFDSLGTDILTARVFSENAASLRVLEKLGFVREGVLRRAIRAYRDVVYDDVLLSLFKEEFYQRRQEVCK